MEQHITLDNGVQLLLCPMEQIRSATLGIWLACGSRQERAGENGAAHFLEHMVFKGTARQSAAQLAWRMDAIGGQMNAFTTKQHTCFYARALSTHLHEALDILCAMLFESAFRQEDVELERGVILEEIGMYQDTPDDLCAERLAAAIFKGSSLARPILGTPATLRAMTGEWLKDYLASHYLPGSMVVSLAGAYEPALVEEIRARFSGLTGGSLPPIRRASYRPAITLKKKSIEQNHLILAFPGLAQGDPRRFAAQLLCSILGGGMSSRLFQQVREKQGLCYSIYSYGTSYADVGFFSIYTALGRETEGQALKTICTELRRLEEDGVTGEELALAREQSKASVLMGLESSTSYMNHMARSVLNGTPILSPDEIIAAYDSVTGQDIHQLAREIFRFDQISLSAVGQVDTQAGYSALLQS